MTEIQLNFNNLSEVEALISILPESKKYKYTGNQVFCLKESITCSCGTKMVHNGYDYVRKKNLGKIKVGKQICPKCGKQHHADKSFWKKLLNLLESKITELILLLRDSDVSWQNISNVFSHIFPIGKTKAMSFFNKFVEQFEYPQDNYLIVNYDEQHPRKGRTQKFRLTLLNYETKIPIAEALFDNKNEETITQFLTDHLDINKKIVIITDLDQRYPKILKKVLGNRVIHQKCLLHLNKLIVKDFGKTKSLIDEYSKYLFLNIFYNRNKELKFLKKYIKKQSRKHFKDDKEKEEWVSLILKKFREYVKTLENNRRRDKKNLTQRPLWKATDNFNKLLTEINLFPKKAKERLKMIKKNWKYLTAFYHIKGCPATNNAVENFYSTSLKTHRKKQLRTDEGLLNHMKLAAIKRVKGGFAKPRKTILEIYGLFKLITV